MDNYRHVLFNYRRTLIESILMCSFADDGLSIFYLIYKYVISLYLVVAWILDIKSYVDNGFIDFYWIYLTKWSFCLLVFSCVYETILVSIRFVLERKGNSGERVYFFQNNHYSTMILWALAATANCIAICVTVVYWTLLYERDPEDSTLEKFSNVNTHLMQVSYV